MSVDININGTSYPFPVQGDNPPWGESLTTAFEALATIVATLSGTGDILTTSFTVANNIASATNITGLSFDTSVVRSAIVYYSIYRSTLTPTEVSECGQLILTYSSIANTWEMVQFGVGLSGVNFTITTAGQIQYTSTNLIGSSYSGKLKFNAKSFVQA